MKNENGIEKSAILKGRTLVNVFQFTSKDDFVNSDKIILDGTTMILNADGTYQNFWLKNNGLVKANTTYLFVVDILENTLMYKSDIPSNSNVIYLTSSVSNNNDSNFFQNGFVITIDELKNGRFIKELTSNPTSIGTEVILTRSFLSPNAISGTLKFKMMIIEYQQGMENWDIPYFEGTQSVKIPVLTTIGKNLLNYSENFEVNSSWYGQSLKSSSVTIVDNKSNLHIKNDDNGVTKGATYSINVPKNTVLNFGYEIIENSGNSKIHIFIHDDNKSFLYGEQNNTKNFITYNSNSNETLNVSYMIENIGEVVILPFISTATSYETFKSKILYCL